ncbi:MAG TPA: phospho-N-acetylmuramoyl-pentapeptide-transferase [Bacillales bacterium]|nr:phospho-N-acetylmuramoyl-pentapeptide-transferase [Bacillales bacterium]
MFGRVLIITIIVAFLVAVLLFPVVIPALRRLKFGQFIREEGPESHLKKAGTPTMGGVIIIAALVIATLIGCLKFAHLTLEVELLLFVTVGFGILGFLDDFIKIVKKRNLGLTSKQKLLGQLIVAAIFYLGLIQAHVTTTVTIPGTDITYNLHSFYFLLVIFMLIGASNGTNLTDGVDGLLPGTAAIAFGAYAVLAWNTLDLDVAIFACAVVGAVLGFLVFNAHPAKVFMGDTGSLALGGGIAALAILTKMEIILVIIGGIFVIETLSVIIQVLSFKTTGRRVFKMSPIHHHYDLSGWSEWRIVVTFWLVGFLFAALGIYIEVWI